jgi:hypothetical protein
MRVVLSVGAALLVVVWNVRVFYVYAIATIPISFAFVVFTVIAITVIRSMCGDRHTRSTSA